MLTDQDIQKMAKVFATKEDVKDLKEDIGGLKESLQSLIVSVDKLAKVIEDLRQEYVAITAKIDQHEKWIHQLAEKLGIKLDY
jgi:uncharacterized coiled-coil DUF342 family protein